MSRGFFYSMDLINTKKSHFVTYPTDSHFSLVQLSSLVTVIIMAHNILEVEVGESCRKNGLDLLSTMIPEK